MVVMPVRASFLQRLLGLSLEEARTRLQRKYWVSEIDVFSPQSSGFCNANYVPGRVSLHIDSNRIVKSIDYEAPDDCQHHYSKPRFEFY